MRGALSLGLRDREMDLMVSKVETGKAIAFDGVSNVLLRIKQDTQAGLGNARFSDMCVRKRINL